MKTRIIFTISLFLITTVMKSQRNRDSIRTIKYDFSTGKFLNSPIKPNHGEPIQLEIININNFYYKVNIDPKDVAIKDKNLFDETSETVKPEKSPEAIDPKKLSASSKIESEIQKPENSTKLKGKIDKEVVSKIASLEKEIKNNETLITIKEIERSKLLVKMKDIDEQLNSMMHLDDMKRQVDSLGLVESQFKTDLQKQINKRTELEKKESKYRAEINKISDKIAEYEEINKDFKKNLLDIISKNKTAKDMIINYLRKTKKMYFELYESANNIYKINENYNNYMAKVCSPELNLVEYKKIRDGIGLENPVLLKEGKLEEGYREINSFDEIKTSLLMKFNDIELYKIKEELAQLSDGQTLITGLNDDILLIKKDISDLSKTVSDLKIKEKLNYVEYLDRLLLEEKTYTKTSNTIQGYEDYLKFDIDITSRFKQEEEKYVIDRSKAFEYREYLRGGIRFDFSIGTVFDIGSKQQEFEVIQDAAGYKIIQKTNNQYIPTIAGMLHSSWRSANNFAFGLTLGVSMDMTKLQLNSLFPGISLLVGRNDKIIFTAGPALRKVTELTNGFKLNAPLISSPVDYTSESYKLGWFVGVSWNLTNKQKSLMRLSY